MAKANTEANSVPNLPTISAAEIHENNLKAFRLENKCHHRLIEGIRALAYNNLVVDDLRFPSIYEYTKLFFNYGHTMTDECIRVAEAFDRLPACKARYEAGKIDFSAIRAITDFEKISRHNEEAWLLSRARDNSHYPACRIIPRRGALAVGDTADL